MAEAEDPALGLGPGQQGLLGVERVDGIEIVAHDVIETDVGRRRDGVGEKEERLAAGRDLDALMVGRVAGDEDGLDAGRDGPVAVDEGEPARCSARA